MVEARTCPVYADHPAAEADAQSYRKRDPQPISGPSSSTAKRYQHRRDAAKIATNPSLTVSLVIPSPTQAMTPLACLTTPQHSVGLPAVNGVSMAM